MGRRFFDNLDDEPEDAQQVSWAGGADEFQTPTLLPADIGGQLVNCIVEDNGRPRNRPGADALDDTQLSAGERVEVMAYFDTPALEYLYVSIDASLRQWTGSAWSTIAAYPFGANTIADMVQGNNTLYCSDGTNQWQHYNGAAWSGALGNTAADPPIGATILCWHTFRMFASGAISSLHDVVYISDLGDAGTGKWNASNVIRVGRGEGERIVALKTIRGNYLAVGKEGSIYVVNADPTVSIANWLIKRLAGSVGCVGKRAMESTGDSLFVVGPDLALREIIPSTVEDVPFEIAPPCSEPAKPYMDRINRAAQSKIVVQKYGRYLLVAVPLDAATEPSHVLAFNLRIRRPAGVGAFTFPAFIGVWTGWTPTAFCVSRFAGVEKLLIGDSDGYVNEWKDQDDQTADATYADNGTDVLATIRSRSWDFGTQRNPKDPESVEVRFVDSTATVHIVAYLDGEEQKRWAATLQTTQNELPLSLPFDLAELGPARETKNMDGQVEFREMYLEIEQKTAGRLEVKSMAASAFFNTQAQE